MIDEEKEAIERINSFKSIKVLYGKIYAMHTEQLEQLQKDIKVVLNLIEKQQRIIEEQKSRYSHLSRDAQKAVDYTFELNKEIEKYKEMYAVSVADRVNSAFKQEYKNNEDLEMLYKGCQIELEEKDKYISKLENKLMYALSPTTHELALNTQEHFKTIIRDNLEEDTYTIKRELKEYWRNI